MSTEATNQQTTQTESVHQNPISIGAAWNKTSKKNGTGFISVAPVGNREKDNYELILRHKESQAELDLFNPATCSVVIMKNTFKTDSESDSRKPDYTLKVFLKE